MLTRSISCVGDGVGDDFLVLFQGVCLRSQPLTADRLANQTLRILYRKPSFELSAVLFDVALSHSFMISFLYSPQHIIYRANQ